MKQESKLVDEQVFNLMDALRAPILTHSSSWASAIPSRLLEVIPIDRLALLLSKQETCTDSELVAFIMTATMEAPMTSEWTDIYTHYACKVCEEHWKEDHWDNIKAPRELSSYTIQYHVEPLRRHIYEKRRKIFKEEMKQLQKKEVTTMELYQPSVPIIMEYEQLQLFV